MKKMGLRFVLFLILGAGMFLPEARAQGVYHNQRLFVVPAPGKVSVDGDLKDWDLSGEILTYVVEASMTYQSAKTAMMYDNEALYISSRVADPTPMLNKADPAVNPDFGWDGDAFQFRLNLDPALGYPLKIGGYDGTTNEALVHMTLWNYTDKKQPVLHLKYGMDYHDAHGYHKGVVPAEKFSAVYVPWTDGKGFTFEYRIPWATLGGPRPLKGGDLSAGAIQIQWSDATGLHSYGGGWAVDLMAHAGFTYQSTHSWGKTIFAEKGNLPKELTQEGVPPVRKMPLKFDFELPKEQVTSVTLINSKGDRVRHIVAAESRPAGKVTESWDGLDDRGKVLPAGDYTWKGAYHDPFQVKHVVSVANSGTPSYNTPDGKGAWGGDWGCPADICFAGDKGLLVWDGSEAGTGLIGVDANMRKMWGYRIGGSHMATDGEWVFVYLDLEKQIRAYGVADGKQINFLRGELWAEHNAVSNTTACESLAVLDGKLYVANAAANEIEEYEAKKGVMGRKLAVPKPTALVVAGPGSLVVLSEGVLRKVALADGKVSDFAKANLDAPRDVAVGPEGSVYVSNEGKLQNVSVFDKDGKYVKSIGKIGGRAMTGPVQPIGNVSPARAGKWDGDAMLNPHGLAVDAKGRLWVMEHDFSPKRVSAWDTATGKLLDEKFGPAFVSTPACMDPADPTRVYCQNVEWEIDLAKGTSKPAAVMIEARPDTPYFWPHMVNHIVFTAKNGKQYMHHKSYQGSAVAGQFLWVRRGDHFEAVAGLMGAYTHLTWRPAATNWQEAAKMPPLIWEDLNGDGVIQKEETRETKMVAQNPHSVVDADLNMYATGMYTELYWQRICPKKIQDNGVPLYDDASIVRFPYGDKHGGNYTYEFTVNPADGSILMYAGTDIKLLDQTELWPITYWTQAGQMVWRYRPGCRWHDMYEFPIPKAGELYGCTKNLGITDGITGYSCYFGQCQLLTTDGVTLGTIMKDGRSGETGADQIQCEWFTGQLVKTKDSRWFLLGGDQDGRVLEVLGLNSVKRFEGKLTVKPEEAKAAEEALAEWSTLKAKSQSLILARCVDKPAWVDIRGVKVNVDAKRSFVAKTAYDKDNLYVRYEMNSPNELTNSTPEVQTPFKGGNCLDIQIATDPNADAKRDKPAPGDVRLLVTRRAGPSTGSTSSPPAGSGQAKAVAVVYRPKVAGFKGEPVVFTSPTGKESFDQIEVWEDVKLDYEKLDGGFNTVVTLPLAKLGFAPKSGTVQKMDVGYIFGNETGNITSKRAYWANRSFSSQVTQDIPNESRLEPAQWGSATVE